MKLDSMSLYTVIDDRILFVWKMMFHVWELLPHEYEELSWVYDTNQDVIVIHHTSEETRTSLWDALITVLPIACRMVVVCDRVLLRPHVIRDMVEDHKVFTFHTTEIDITKELESEIRRKQIDRVSMALFSNGYISPEEFCTLQKERNESTIKNLIYQRLSDPKTSIRDTQIMYRFWNACCLSSDIKTTWRSDRLYTTKDESFDSLYLGEWEFHTIDDSDTLLRYIESGGDTRD